ncbi:hypothetical protein [Nocardia sp. NPDC057272]|uniref:hypothetical protein n=1 Tax=Nocardia sp. NPDC057272 TaxID=3346079 RepID=UPI00363B8435
MVLVNLSGDLIVRVEVFGENGPMRTDLDIWCRRLPGFGWVVCNAADEVSSRPFNEPGQGEIPPEGVWVSRKGERSYVYDLVRTDP